MYLNHEHHAGIINRKMRRKKLTAEAVSIGMGQSEDYVRTVLNTPGEYFPVTQRKEIEAYVDAQPDPIFDAIDQMRDDDGN